MDAPTEGVSLPKTLTVSECARITGCFPYEITRAVNKGELKGSGTGRKRRIKSEDLCIWVLKRIKDGTGKK